MDNNWTLTEEDHINSLVLYERERVYPLTLPNMFRSALYCLLTPNDGYSNLIKVFNGLLIQGLDKPKAIQESEDELSHIVRQAGKHIQKEKSIRGLADWWLTSDLPKQVQKDAKEDKKREFELRNEIAKASEAPGLGMKCASLLLRTCGYKNLVPVDTWMIKYLQETGHNVDEKDLEKRRGIPDKRYLVYEKILTAIAKKHKKEPGMFQLALWCKNASWRTRKTNEKLKQTMLAFNRLFVALKTEFFNDFLYHGKTFEIRGYSGNFNEKTVTKGRAVQLRKGFSEESLWGKVGKIVIGSIDEILAQVYFKELEPRAKTLSQAKREIKKGMKKKDRYIAFEVVF